MREVVVVGAGLFGATVARSLAERDVRVLVIERRAHVGGNCYSEIDPGTGIERHFYGTHVFHTSDERVWRWIGQFSEFTRYRHRVFVEADPASGPPGVYTLPINLATINRFYGVRLCPSEARTFLAARTAKIGAPENLEELALAAVGEELYRAFLRGYTRKQWGRDPRELPASILRRLAVRFNYDDGYFQDRYEGLPVDGYGALFDRILAHPNIAVALGQDFATVADDFSEATIVYTGPIDAFFGHVHGRLGWRGVQFDSWLEPVDDFQGAAVINFADPNVPYTRVHEWRHLRPDRPPSDCTWITREFAGSGAGDPAYPIGTVADLTLLRVYRDLALHVPRVHFGGRLGSYRYLNMDQTIAQALDLAERLAT